MLSLYYDVSYMPIALFHAYRSNPYVNSVSAPQPSRLLSTGMQDLKRVYNVCLFVGSYSQGVEYWIKSDPYLPSRGL